MTNYEYIKAEDTVRTLCDGMTPRQVKDLRATLLMDLEDRENLPEDHDPVAFQKLLRRIG